MISFLQGNVADIFEGMLILEVNGIGFSIQMAHPEFFQKNKSATLIIHMQWHQEQGPALYGFSSEQEKTIFLMVTDCSGFGPKIALLVLRKFSPLAFLKTIQIADMKAFSSISGIGPKKAEQLVVQLKHKVNALLDKNWHDQTGDNVQALEQWRDISQALQSLHYSRQEIDQALSFIAKDGTDNALPFDVLLRKALSFLAKK